MVMVGMIIFGVLAYIGMPLNITPSIDIPYVLVQTTYAGASPDLIESQISKKIEDAVSMISGLDTITSYSLENVSLVLLKFTMDVDVDTAVQDVTQKVNNISNDLPDDADDPIFQKININELPLFILTEPSLACSYISSELPWSAVMHIIPPASSTACLMRPSCRSMASMEQTTALNTPVCPTMSPLGKLSLICWYLPLFMASITASAISAHFIHGRCSKGTTSLFISM